MTLRTPAYSCSPPQFVLLLAMFVKPMLMPQRFTQSGGAVYRRLVIRNIVCTVGIALAYTVTTGIVALSWQNDGIGKEQVKSFLARQDVDGI